MSNKYVSYNNKTNEIHIKVPNTGYMKNPYKWDLDTQTWDSLWKHLKESKSWFINNTEMQKELFNLECKMKEEDFDAKLKDNTKDNNSQ